MKRRIYIFVNGIQDWPGNSRLWNKRAVTWIHLHTDSRAQTDEYFTTALTVWIHERDRAREMADLLRRFTGWEIIIVAHSNGARVSLGALKICEVRIEALHLVSGACDADFNRNGLNSALRSYRVGRVFVYVAEKDWAMGFEDTLAGKALFGLYASDQPLGLSGPRNVESRMYSRIKQVNERHYGHSSWWAPVNFERTMRGFVLI